jgi:hypothetical protein
VGDFVPDPGKGRSRGPQLADMYRRMRPDYLQRWLARPARSLPYTPMPQNFEVNTLKGQDLYKGTSTEQVQALVDLLVNYDRLAKDELKIKPLVKIKPAEPAGSSPDTKTGAGAGQGE